MRMLPFLLLLVSALAGAALGHECARDWVYYGGSCYSYSHSLVTWADALAICKVSNAKLVEIESEKEHNFLAALSRNSGAKSVWIGGSDIFREGKFAWVSTGKDVKGYTNWGKDQPSNTRNDEDCMTLWDGVGFMWNDDSCTKTLNFVCETSPDLHVAKTARHITYATGPY